MQLERKSVTFEEDKVRMSAIAEITRPMKSVASRTDAFHERNESVLNELAGYW